ncbi:MAG: tetratricopeptide (TPR) repeat protein [Planctomycetota bacterium]
MNGRASVVFERQTEAAVAAYKAGDKKQAKACCRKILRRDNANFNALQIMAMALRAEEHFEAAVDYYLKAARVAPLDSLVSQMQIDAAGCLEQLGQLGKALTLLDPLLADDLTNTAALHRKAVILRSRGEELEALQYFKQIVTYPPALCSGAELTRGKAHWHILTAPGLKPTLPDIEAAVADLDWIEDIQERENLFFAIYNGYERVQQYALAWEYLNKANALVWKRVAFDLLPLHRSLDRLYQQIEAMPSSIVEPEHCDCRPVFVAGLPRSGSTLLESVLLEHPGVTSKGESSFVGEQYRKWFEPQLKDDDLAGELFSRGIEKYLGIGQTKSQVVIDKTPNNFNFAVALLQGFPQMRMLIPMKTPLEACLSLYRQHFLKNAEHGYSYNLAATVLYYRWHEKICSRLQRRFPTRFLIVDYCELTDAKSGLWAELFDFCGLQWDPVFLNYFQSKRRVSTTSAAQVRQAVSTTYRDRAERYGSVIDELSRLLEMSFDELLAHSTINNVTSGHSD